MQWFRFTTQNHFLQTHYVMMLWCNIRKICCPDVDSLTVARCPCPVSQSTWRIPEHSLYSWNPSVSSWFTLSVRVGVAYKVRTAQDSHILRNLSWTNNVAVNLDVNIRLFTVHGSWRFLSDCHVILRYRSNATFWTFVLLWFDCLRAILKRDFDNQEKSFF